MANKEIKSLKITDKNGQSYTLSVPANGANVDTSDFALKSELDEFDPKAHEARVNAFIDKAKKDVLTLDRFDTFDTGAYKSELNTIADEVKSKMAVFDSLSEIDLDELKAQIKAEILAELRTAADGAGA